MMKPVLEKQRTRVNMLEATPIVTPELFTTLKTDTRLVK